MCPPAGPRHGAADGDAASEIAGRIVRNLDDEGRILCITDAKTQAGIRCLRVPERLQPCLRRIADGMQPTDRLFGPKANRQTVLRHARRICRAAGVPTVYSHGLRGTHASLAMTAGATGALIAAALGHESFTTTERQDARPRRNRGRSPVGRAAGTRKKFPRAA